MKKLALSRSLQAQLKGHGFKLHGGKATPPVGADDYVELIVRTAEGFGSSGIIRAAHAPYWDGTKHKGGLGEIVAWRPAERGEPRKFDKFERMK